MTIFDNLYYVDGDNDVRWRDCGGHVTAAKQSFVHHPGNAGRSE
jgi:hypothetical protein